MSIVYFAPTGSDIETIGVSGSGVRLRPLLSLTSADHSCTCRETWILVADSRKVRADGLAFSHFAKLAVPQNSEVLGTTWTQGIPIEVVVSCSSRTQF